MDSGDTAWILTSTALVLFMTLPGLALFYAGLVRSKNVLSVLMQCFSVACVASLVWLVIGYSIAFGEGNAIWGGLGKMFLAGVERDSLSGTIPETVFFSFQMTFAIITPALIIGAFVERIGYGFVLAFSAAWLIVVYAPVTHWVWGGGWLADMQVYDFAGGIVVHATAGVSALVVAKMLGARKGFPTELKPPHSPGMVMTGAAMLWVGWFGFNGGSALAANGDAGMALTVTHISAATASLSWVAYDYMRFGKASLIGIVTGMVAGLATITPASGFVGPIGALILGGLAGVICNISCSVVKDKMGIDDSLDVFAVHGVGGILGSLLVAILAAESLGGVGFGDNSMSGQIVAQVVGVVIVSAWSLIATIGLVMVIRSVFPLRVEDEMEAEGLDLPVHGERGYDIR